ncbi:MAG: acyl-CoA dehydrogenase family protein [Proteobacteria bacterium]|nr:acyl-CoA dehydrogenase family protein [Pseudomonadota bacterium]
MDFDLTDEQRMLKESARKLMEREVVPYLNGFPTGRPMALDDIKGLLKKLIPLGYLGNVIPEEYGGAGLDYMTYGCLMEELDPSIYGLVMLAGSTPRSIYILGDEEQKRKYIPPMLSAEKVGCSCITEPNVGSYTAGIQTRAIPDGDDYVINGAKMWITNGSFADMAFVLASSDPEKGAKGLSRFIVDKDVSPWEARPIPTMGDDGRIPAVGELVFEDCRVPKRNMLGDSGGGLKATLIGFQAARCLVGMGSLIFATRAIEAAVQYAKERTQFGRPIGQFQLIQDKIADMAALTDAARLLIYRGLSLVDKGGRCARETSMAKFFATEAAVKVTSMAIQIHGAYGLSTEYPVERLFRGARMMTIPDGTTEIQKLIVAREILGMQAFV